MTKESICMRCVELIRLKVKRPPGETSDEKRLCSLGGIYIQLMPYDTIEECSRYVEVLGDEVRKK